MQASKRSPYWQKAHSGSSASVLSHVQTFTNRRNNSRALPKGSPSVGIYGRSFVGIGSLLEIVDEWDCDSASGSVWFGAIFERCAERDGNLIKIGPSVDFDGLV